MDGLNVTFKYNRILKQHGVTFVELLIVLVIIGVVLSFAIPSLSRNIRINRVDAIANQIYSDISYARLEALRSKKSISICASSDGETCINQSTKWAKGWIVFIDKHIDFPKSSTIDKILLVRNSEEGVLIESDTAIRERFGFYPNGTLALQDHTKSGVIWVCNTEPPHAIRLLLPFNGQPVFLKRITNALCL